MPATPANSERVPFLTLEHAQLVQLVESWNWPKFRADQLFEWVYGKGVYEWARMTNLSRQMQVKLDTHLTLLSASLTRRQDSSDGTIKLLLDWGDFKSAETVLIPDGERRTACVSSQVGCPAGCKFCASGVNGVQGNLTAGQIVEQVVALNQILSGMQERINHVVFMGMGEPLANYANVLQAVRILHEPKGLNIGARKITISTVGVPPRIRQLAQEGLPVNLALSLHAPNEELRKELIPWAEHFELVEILDACREYFDKTGREITLEYILLSGVNDRPEHARQLAKLCKTLRANVNLLRYNEVEGLPFARPKSDDVVRFQEILRAAKVNAHVRKSRGRDIDAACGQLRKRESDEATAAIAMTVRKDGDD